MFYYQFVLVMRRCMNVTIQLHLRHVLVECEIKFLVFKCSLAATGHYTMSTFNLSEACS